MQAMFAVRDPEQSSAPQMFGNAGRDHMDKYGSEPDHFAWIGWKNHKHSVNNPYAQFQDSYTLDEIKDARMIHEPLTKLQCSPTSDGAAAVIVASERFVEEHDLWDRAIEIAGQSMVTDLASTFAEDTDCIKIVGADMSRQAADEAYAEAGVGADEVDVCELHDCFSANELITYEALGFAAEGEGHKLVEAEATTYGGDGPVVNPSGGLISSGPPSAPRPRPVPELTWQLRGQADARQVEGAQVASSTTSASAAQRRCRSTAGVAAGRPPYRGSMRVPASGRLRDRRLDLLERRRLDKQLGAVVGPLTSTAGSEGIRRSTARSSSSGSWTSSALKSRCHCSMLRLRMPLATCSRKPWVTTPRSSAMSWLRKKSSTNCH